MKKCAYLFTIQRIFPVVGINNNNIMSSYHPGADYFLKRAMVFWNYYIVLHEYSKYVCPRTTCDDNESRISKAACVMRANNNTIVFYFFFFFAVAANRFLFLLLKTISDRRRLGGVGWWPSSWTALITKICGAGFHGHTRVYYRTAYCRRIHFGEEQLSGKSRHTTCARGRKREKKKFIAHNNNTALHIIGTTERDAWACCVPYVPAVVRA